MKNRLIVTILAVTPLLFSSIVAQAQSAPRRSYGIGTYFGAGIAAATATSSTGGSASAAGPALLLPSVELQFFTDSGYSVDLSVPLTNIIIASAVTEGLWLNLDAIFNFNVGSGGVRFIAGPGLGFGLYTGGSFSAGSLRIPALLGLELLTAGRGFGFKVGLKPWLEFGFAGGSGQTARGVGGGALFVLGLTGYGTNS